MRTLFYAFLAGLFLFPQTFSAQKKQVEVWPHLNQATVYLNSAKLDYSAQATLPQGNVLLIFKGLSPYLIPESVSMEGKGNAGIVNMEFQNDFLVNERDNLQIQKMENQLLELNRKINRIESEINALNDEIHFLKANGDNQKSGLSGVQQYISYYKKRYLQIQEQIFNKEQKLKPLTKQASKLKQQLHELKGKAKRQAKDLIVHLYVPRGGNFSFNISYVTQRAGWKPVYTIRTTKGKSSLQWNYQAEISQYTGIDWTDIPVTLSSLNPSYHTNVPKPYPWYLSNMNLGVTAYSTKAKQRKVQNDYPVTLEAEESVYHVPTQIQESDLDIQYTLEKRYSIYSGKEPVVVQLQQFTTPAEFSYFSVPYINPQAYLTARIPAGELSKHRMIQGKARLYYDDRYTGKTHINPQATEEYIKLSFGSDPEVVVRRKTTENFRDYKSLSGKVIVKRSYEISIKNNKKIPVDIVVKDRIPVSQDEKIEVSNVFISNKGKKDKQGIITWKIKLNPGEKITLKYGFEVKFPRSYSINL